jgi:hypothetical protein
MRLQGILIAPLFPFALALAWSLSGVRARARVREREGGKGKSVVRRWRGPVLLRHAHDSSDRSGLDSDRSASDLGLQFELGLPPVGRRRTDFADYHCPCAIRKNLERLPAAKAAGNPKSQAPNPKKLQNFNTQKESKKQLWGFLRLRIPAALAAGCAARKSRMPSFRPQGTPKFQCSKRERETALGFSPFEISLELGVWDLGFPAALAAGERGPQRR